LELCCDIDQSTLHSLIDAVRLKADIAEILPTVISRCIAVIAKI
jgi:hypothetical protein